MSDKKGWRIVVVGSNSFDDKSFVFGMLDNFKNLFSSNTGINIERVYSSSYTQISEFVKEWAIKNKIEYKNHHFFAEGRDNPLFNNIDIPDFILKNDPFFTKGKEFLQSEDIDTVIAMPKPDGDLGVKTRHIMNMAKLADAKTMDASEVYKDLLSVRDEVKKTKEKSLDVTNLSSINKF